MEDICPPSIQQSWKTTGVNNSKNFGGGWKTTSCVKILMNKTIGTQAQR